MTELPAYLPSGTDVWPYMKADITGGTPTAILGVPCRVSQRPDGGVRLLADSEPKAGEYVVKLNIDGMKGVYAGFDVWWPGAYFEPDWVWKQKC